MSDQGSASPPPLRHANVFIKPVTPRNQHKSFPWQIILIIESSKGVAKSKFFIQAADAAESRQSKETNFCTVKQQHKELNALILFPGNSPWFVGYIQKKKKLWSLIKALLEAGCAAWTLKCEVHYYFFKPLEAALLLTGHDPPWTRTRANTPRSFPINKQPPQMFSPWEMFYQSPAGKKKKKWSHRNMDMVINGFFESTSSRK